MSATRTAVFLASAVAWLALVHLSLGVELLSTAVFIALVALAAFGVGYGMEDPGTAMAMFIGLALAGLAVGVIGTASGTAVLGPVLAFGSGPAMIAAESARAGGMKREERC